MKRAIPLVLVLAACDGPDLPQAPIACGGGPAADIRGTVTANGMESGLAPLSPVWRSAGSDHPASLALVRDGTYVVMWGFGSSAPDSRPLPVGAYSDLHITVRVPPAEGHSNQNRVIVDASEPRDGGYCLAGRFEIELASEYDVDGEVAGWFRTM